MMGSSLSCYLKYACIAHQPSQIVTCPIGSTELSELSSRFFVCTTLGSKKRLISRLFIQLLWSLRVSRKSISSSSCCTWRKCKLLNQSLQHIAHGPSLLFVPRFQSFTCTHEDFPFVLAVVTCCCRHPLCSILLTLQDRCLLLCSSVSLGRFLCTKVQGQGKVRVCDPRSLVFSVLLLRWDYLPSLLSVVLGPTWDSQIPCVQAGMAILASRCGHQWMLALGQSFECCDLQSRNLPSVFWLYQGWHQCLHSWCLKDTASLSTVSVAVGSAHTAPLPRLRISSCHHSSKPNHTGKVSSGLQVCVHATLFRHNTRQIGTGWYVSQEHLHGKKI